MLLCGCALVEQRPPDTAPDLQPGSRPLYEVLKDRYTQDPDLLVGRWEWQWSTAYYTAGGRPHTRTPETTGETVMLTFTVGDTLETYRNGELEKSAFYQVKRRTYDNGTVSEYPLLLINGASSEFAVGEDTLLISTVDRDGPESIYVRAD